MSYSKALEAYPPEFGDLIEVGATSGVALQMPSEKDAKRLQGRLYAYKGVLKKEAQGPAPAEAVKSLYALSNRCQIRAEGTTLILRPLDQDPDAMLIRSAFGVLEMQPETAPAKRADGLIMVPINPAHLPPWLATLAEKRSET